MTVSSSPNGLRVLLQAVIVLSNTPVEISVIVLTVPKSVVRNQHVGIIFREKQCIDILRQFLKAKGLEIGEEMWEDFTVQEFINEDCDPVCV